MFIKNKSQRYNFLHCCKTFSTNKSVIGYFSYFQAAIVFHSFQHTEKQHVETGNLLDQVTPSQLHTVLYIQLHYSIFGEC